MPIYPVPTPIFHITAIPNLRSIAAAGGLLAKNQVLGKKITAANIAYQSVQGHRAIKVVPVGSGGTVHDYVPFYFAPRSPMLMTINSGNVPGCTYRQDDIVHLTTTIEMIRAAQVPFVFSDANAATALANFYDDLTRLTEVDWALLLEGPCLEGYCRYWHNVPTKPRYVQRMEKRMAEFLAFGFVPVAAITEIGVRTENGKQQVRAALAGTGWNPPVRVVPGWYY